MKIISYNVNGIRAAQRKGLLEWLAEASPDLLCLQETKAQPDQLDEALLKPEGYHTYWFSAEKKGYSGVAIYTKKEPKHVAYGIGMEAYDKEGRALRVDFEELSVLCLYLPSGSSGDHRQEAKDHFLEDFLPYVDKLKTEIPRLVICGDFNICHTVIDIHDPVRNKDSSGFLPHERAWLTDFLDLGFVDSFRMLHPDEPDHYSWWSYRANARARNKGWRIDYHMVTDSLQDRVKAAGMLTEVKHSDHCPIFLTLD